MSNDVDKQWVAQLKNGGYEPENPNVFNKNTRTSKLLEKYSRPSEKVLELGCGNGRNLVRLALHDRICEGIDVSEDVVLRGKKQFQAINDQLVRKINVDIKCQNVFELKAANEYDMVFQVGVVEHFLNSDDRKLFHDIAYKALKKGGYYVNIVPSGFHPFRRQKKTYGLNGYVIPEIDYTIQLAKKELRESGFHVENIDALSLFSYFSWAKLPWFCKLGKYLRAFELLGFSKLLIKHGTTLVFVGKK